MIAGGFCQSGRGAGRALGRLPVSKLDDGLGCSRKPYRPGLPLSSQDQVIFTPLSEAAISSA
jgi:hypothetical protein